MNEKIQKDTLLVRPMDLEELKIVFQWAIDEGWNIGKHDHEAYYEMDPKGFLLLLLNGEPIGSISVVKYSEQFAFIGLFIVKPAYRGSGYGTKLWEAGLEYLAESKSIGLYAVPQQVFRYTKSGFESQYSNQRWERTVQRRDIEYLPKVAKNPQTLFQKMIEYDKSVFFESREKMFEQMLQMPNTSAFVTTDEEESCVTGYGVVRPCQEGYRVGPVYANSIGSALKLAEILLANIPSNQKVIIDIPEINKFTKTFVEYFKLEHISEVDTVAMFKGKFVNNTESCYAIASLEIG